MTTTSRPLNRPVPGFYQLPQLGAAPGVSPSNAARFYNDGTNLLASIAGAAYVALATLGGNTFTDLVTIDTSAAPALSIDTDAVSGTIARIRHDVSTTPTGALTDLLLDMTTNWAAGNVAQIGLDVRIPAHTTAAAAGQAAIAVNSDATVARVVDIDVANVSGTLAFIRYGAATSLTGALTCLNIDASTNITPGSQVITALSISVGASTEATATGISLTSTQSNVSSYGITMTMSGTGSASGGGISVTLSNASSASIGILSTNAGSTGAECFRASITTTGTNDINGFFSTRTVVPASGALYSGRTIYVENAPNGTGGGFTEQGYLCYLEHLPTGSSGGAGLDTTVGLRIDRTPVSSTSCGGGGGEWIVLGGFSSADTFGLRADHRGVLGTAVGNGVIEVKIGAATIHTGQLVGIECNIATNATLTNNVAYIGQRILIPATTAASAALQGALVISSDATAARAIDVDIANTSGTPIICRYGAATTPNAVVMMTLDMSTNVTTNTNANIALDLTMLAADRMTSAPLRANGMRVFVNAGIPIDANGTDGDLYVDTAGDKDAFRPTLYQRQSAVWVGVA